MGVSILLGTHRYPPNPHRPPRIGARESRSFDFFGSFAVLLKIENIRNWSEKEDLDAIQQWKCTEFFCGSFLYFFDFLRSFFRGKVLEKSSISLLDVVPGHNGPLGTHWGPHGPHMGPMLEPCCSNMGPMLDPCWSNMGPCWTHVGPRWWEDDAD